MEFLYSLHEALPWYLQLDGSSRLAEMIGDWGAERGLIRGDDWTQIFVWIYGWLLLGALAWGVGAGLLVLKRPEQGRFAGDPGKHRDAVVTGVLRVAAGAALGAGVILVLFVLAVLGPGPVIWAGVAYLVYRLSQRSLRRLRQRRGAAAAAPPARRKRAARVET